MTLLIAAIGPKDWAISIWLRDYFTASAVNVRQSPATAMLWLVVIGSAVALLVLGNRYSLLTRYHDAFNNQFEKLRRWYGGMLAWCLGHRLLVIIAFTGLMVSAFAIMPMVGQDFFPSVDAGLVRLHVRAPAGTRIEETERYFAQVAELIRSVIPEDEIDSILDNIGIPYSGINTALSDGTIVSPADGEVLISLKEHHKPTADYIVQLKRKLDEQLPELITFFQPPDMASQVLNFGVAAPIDIQISGPRKSMEANFALIQQMRRDVEKVPGAVDVRLQQVMNTPDIRVDVDRTLAGQMGLSQRDVANDLLISLASNGQTYPNFWTDQRTGVNYHVMVQTPQYRIDSMDALNASPVASSGGRNKNMQLLGNLATVRRGYSPANLTHYDIRNTFDIQLGIRGTDLETVARGVQKVIDEYTPKLPKGSFFTLRGQAQSMHSSFAALGYGIIFAIVLVYLLMVINFQSWIDPLIILMALPGAIAGIVWILFVTGTTLSVPALMGAIMSIGVATANSILMVTFANDQREEGLNAHDAALCAGMTRLRPVLMTAAAMLIGMLPMAMGMGEGGEQNAPLGRAVIGGLFLATFATLILVPVMYSWLRKAAPSRTLEPELQYK
jgi:multidrug efflux pump subunit AcrB